MVVIYSLIYIILLVNFNYSKGNSLENVISRVSVFLTNDTNNLTNDLKKNDQKIINDTINLNVKGDLLDILEKKLPVFGRHLKKLDTKYNLKYNLLSQESQNFIIEIEKLIPQNMFDNNKIFDKFIKDTLIPKYSKLTEPSKIELKQFYSKSKGIQMAATKSRLQ